MREIAEKNYNTQITDLYKGPKESKAKKSDQNKLTNKHVLKAESLSFKNCHLLTKPRLNVTKRVGDNFPKNEQNVEEGAHVRHYPQNENNKKMHDELAQKRLRMIRKLRREEEERLEEKKIVQKGHGQTKKRRHSFRKKRPSSYLANHWTTEDEEWIEKDDTLDEEDHPWFPCLTSDTSDTTDW